MKNPRNSVFLVFFTALLLFSSCKKDEILTDPAAKLEFSTGSILFDTVFTTVGSVTKSFIVYNRNSGSIRISSIRLAGGSASNFRINVDGLKGIQFSDIEIKEKDSLFVFAEVTVDPNNLSNPLVIQDSIIFETNGNVQDVNLEAWGQDAYFHTPNVFPTNGLPPYSIIAPAGSTIQWNSGKPHVIYGYAVIDSAGLLNMNAGCRVYMHPGSVLWVYKDGTLKINGQKGSEVVIQGDRLEPQYAEGAGQWGYIWLSPGSKNNTIDWAIIKNGYAGIVSDTVKNWNNPTLTISNSMIRNMSVAALYGRGTFIKGWNCVFSNCGQYVGAFTIGGRYNFYHCTFANYWDGGNRSFPTLLLSNYYEDANEIIHPRPLDSAYFYNCLVYGDITSEEELKLDKVAGAAFNYKFHHTLLRTELPVTGPEYINVIVNQDPLFNNPGNHDYRIKDPLSPVIAKGDNAFISVFPTDLAGRPRLADPNITPGAYEYDPF